MKKLLSVKEDLLTAKVKTNLKNIALNLCNRCLKEIRILKKLKETQPRINSNHLSIISIVFTSTFGDVFNWNHFEMRFLNLRINFYLLRTFCPHLGSFCVVSSFTTFRPNFTSGLLQVIYCDLG